MDFSPVAPESYHLSLPELAATLDENSYILARLFRYFYPLGRSEKYEAFLVSLSRYHVSRGSFLPLLEKGGCSALSFNVVYISLCGYAKCFAYGIQR